MTEVPVAVRSKSPPVLMLVRLPDLSVSNDTLTRITFHASAGAAGPWSILLSEASLVRRSPLIEGRSKPNILAPVGQTLEHAVSVSPLDRRVS